MKTSKRIMAAALAVTTAAFTMAGCSSTTSSSAAESTGSTSESTGSTSTSEATGDTVEIRFSWWGNEDRHQATLEAIALYEEQNPGVKIVGEYSSFDGYQDKLMAQVAGENAPDIFTCIGEWYPALYELNAMADLTDAVDWSYFDQATIDACSYNGTIYGACASQNAFGVYYNKTVADEYGIALPEGDYTWDDLTALMAEVYEKSGGTVYGCTELRLNAEPMKFYGYTAQAKPAPYMWDSDKLTFTAEDVTEFYQFVESLPEGSLLPPDIAFSTDTFTSSPVAQGQVLFEFNSMGSFAAVQSQTENELGILPLPVGENGETANEARPGLILSVYENSKVKEEAAKFIDWFVNSEDAAKVLKMSRGVLPTSIQREAVMAEEGLLSDSDLVINDAVNKVLAGEMHTFVPGPLGSDQINYTIGKNIGQEVAFGQLTPEEAGQKFMEESEKAITY